MHTYADEGGVFRQTEPTDVLYELQPEGEEPDGEQPLQYSKHVILRLREPENDEDGLPVEDSLRDEALRLGYDQLVELLDTYDVAGQRLIQSVSPKQVREFENPGRYPGRYKEQFRDNERTELRHQLLKLLERAELRQQLLEIQPPSLNLYWRIDARWLSEDAIASIMDHLMSLGPDSGVALAYREVQVELAAVNTSDDTGAAKQRYMNPAPQGINAKAAWDKFIGPSLLNNVGFADIEEDWRLDHLDFNPLLRNVAVVAGQRRNRAKEITHGTSTLGIVMAVDNAIGIVGLAPAMAPPQIYLASVYDGQDNNNVADAITAAVMNGVMQPGDVLLLEVTRSGRPTEIDCADFTAIWQAVFLHDIIVIEAAGNGRINLDTDSEYVNRDCSGNNGPTDDSGAIIVGACRSAVKNCNGKVGHARWWAEDAEGNVFGSSYGTRIDCHAWGESVFTTRGNGGYDNFGGTSAASAIIAGVAVLVQSLWKIKNNGTHMMPSQMRDALRDSDNGTPYCPDFTPREIRAMPDLVKLLTTLGL